METWKDKAKGMIQAEAKTQFIKAGNKYPVCLSKRKHKPYALPIWCNELVECLANDNEEKAKAIFNWEFLRDY